MKKLLSVAAMALAMALAFTSCASSGAKSEGSGIPHPRSYVLDVIDGGETLNLVWNQYGPNYQVTPFFTSLLKKDKPQAGDTVTFKMKAVSDVDLPLLLCYPCSTSPSWTNLADESFVMAENVKAGEAFECEVTVVLTQKMGADFALCMQYDNEDQEVKTGSSCVLTLERVCESTDTAAESGAAAPVGPQTINVEIQKYAALCQIETNHPWVNGAQDMSVIANYQATPEVTAAAGDYEAKAGDTLVVTWKAVSDTDIAKLYCRPVDCSAAANWWTELINPIWGEEDDTTAMDEQMLLAENIVAGEPFEVTKTYVLEKDVIAQINLCLWYDCDPENPKLPGPALIKLVRD